MIYPDELCQLIIRNMEIIEEAPNVVECVEEKLFAAINERIKEHVAKQSSWKGIYTFVTDDDGETHFAPEDWPETHENGYLAYYKLHLSEPDETDYWISNALGIRSSALCLQCIIKNDVSGLSAKEHKKALHDFYAAHTTIADTGFLITKGGASYLPFTLEAAKVADEYPDFDESLSVLDKALDSLFKVHPIFDSFVKKLQSK